MEKRRLVIVESPYNGDIEKNIEYAIACMKDCFKHGEIPFVSHLLYAQNRILDDSKPEERELSIEAGLTWGKFADATVVYVDLEISRGKDKIPPTEKGTKCDYCDMRKACLKRLNQELSQPEHDNFLKSENGQLFFRFAAPYVQKKPESKNGQRKFRWKKK